MQRRIVTAIVSLATAALVVGITPALLERETGGGPSAVGEPAGAARRKPKYAKVLYAIVSSDGTLEDGKRADTAEKTSTGNCFVKFDRKVPGCAYAVTIRGSVPALYRAQPEGGKAKIVQVNVNDTTGGSVDKAFSLVVAC